MPVCLKRKDIHRNHRLAVHLAYCMHPTIGALHGTSAPNTKSPEGPVISHYSLPARYS